MTLPFRRRHHDDEAPHDRARALISAGFLGPLADADTAWLEGHLARCPECSADREGYLADRAVLQSLRSTPPVPPRDLWARTSAGIEREAAARSRHGFFDRALGPRPRGVPLGPLAGVLVAAVVLVVAVMPPSHPIVPSRTGTPPPVAIVSLPAETRIAVDNEVAWLQRAPDGAYSIVFGAVDHVCADASSAACRIAPGSPAPIELVAPPQALVLSPGSDQLAVVPSADQPDGDLVIVTVPTPLPSGSLPASASPSSVATAAPSRTPPSQAPPSPTQATASNPVESSGPPRTSHAIIHGVVVVGEPAYSPDGQWFAFSARPKDGLHGPDLYVWRVGDDAATQLSTDGLTYFAGWFGQQIVASTVALDGQLGARAVTGSGAPSVPGATATPTLTPTAAPASTDAGASPPASGGPEASPAAVELHPTSFLLDPTTGVRTAFARPDVWLPAIDPMGRFVAYWSGTVTPGDEPGRSPFGGITSLRPATGSLVIDGWSAPLILPSPPPSTTPGATSDEATPTAIASLPATAVPSDRTTGTPSGLESPGPSAVPAIAAGPTGTAMTLAEGPLTDFDARFDPTGTRLAVWTADPGDESLGPLRLIVLDPRAGAPDPTLQPLPETGVVALRGFSIDDGRLGWVTPSGQNGQPSSVEVLAWSGDAFGQVETVLGGNPQIVR